MNEPYVPRFNYEDKEAPQKEPQMIYISRNGQRFGPYTFSQLQADLDAGNTVGTDSAWYEGVTSWTPVSAIAGLRCRVVPPPPPQLQMPAYIPVVSVPQKSGGSVTAIIILAVVLPLIGIIFGMMRAIDPETRRHDPLAASRVPKPRQRRHSNRPRHGRRARLRPSRKASRQSRLAQDPRRTGPGGPHRACRHRNSSQR